MVAIVSGGTPGLNLGSREVLGQQGVTGNAAQGRRGEGVYVDVARGALVFETTDDQLVARGPDAAVVRTYDSTGSFNDDNGDGWSSGVVSLQVFGAVNAAGSSLLRVDRDGSTGAYHFDAGRGLYVGTDGGGAYDTIAYVAADSQFEWRDGGTGATQRFEGSGAYRLLASRDAGGNAMTYAYGAGGFLASVTTANGESTLYDYSGSNLAQVRTVADGVAITRVRYLYDGASRLSRVQVDLTPADNSMADLNVYETVFTYDGASKRVASIAQSDGTQLAFTYVAVGGAFKVETVTDALGARTRFDYGAGFATVTDALGLVTRYDYDAAGQLTAITAPGGPAATRRFAYDGNGNVVAVTDGEGRATLFDYDGAGNQVLQRDALGNTVQRLFDQGNRLLTETTYTQPDPDAAGPGQPAGALTRRWIYDAGGRNLLRFTLSAAGAVTEYRYDGFGQRIAEITYDGGPYPVGAWGPDGSPTEPQMMDWVAQQDRTATRRVDLAYDGRGQLQSRTTYATVNAAGEGIADGSHSVERFVRDRAGQLLQSVSATQGVTTFSYDGLGRVLASTDALGQVTLTYYEDANRRTLVALAHGLVRTSVYDAANRLVTVAERSTAGHALGETNYFYDAGDRLRMVQDPTGVRSWMLYDDAGRKVADIDGNGTLTEFSYDRSDRLVRTMRWGTAAGTAGLVDASGRPVTTVTLAALRPGASASDQGIWREYDQAGRLVRLAEQAGTLGRATVTETRYDGASRAVEVVRFANTVAADGGPGSVAPGLVPMPAPSADDRVTRNFHDADGLLAGTLDAEGFLTVFRYDAAGQLNERIAYANATDPLLRATGALAQLVPAASAADIREVTLYDGKGRAIGHLDGEGYLTETVYDANGNATQTVRYATRVTAAVTVATRLGMIRVAPTSADQVTRRAYDALGRLVQETSPQGVVTRYGYDAGGRLASTERAAGTDEVRTLLARYDLQGRLTGELSAAGAALLTGGQTQAEVDAIWAGHGTLHTYDAASRRTSSTNALGQRTVFFYDADGAQTHAVNALGEVRETRYDARGRARETIAYANRIATAGLDGGLATPALEAAVAAVANAALDSRVTVTYTHDGKMASETDALGNVRTFTYNAFGDETGVQWTGTGVNQVDSHAVDRRGLRRETIRDAAGIRAFESTVHDAFGRAVRVVDANGNARQQEFDRLGRVISTRDPLNALRSTAYDAFGRTLRQTDALGNVTSYAYDAGTRTMRVTTPEGIVSTTTYTRHGQVFSIEDGRGQLTRYAYDRDGRLERTTTPLTTQSSAYDAAGRLTETVDANGNKVAYSYDAANRVLTRRVDPAGLDLVTSYAHDGKGQRVSVTDANGVVTTIEYDRKGQVLRQTVDPAGLRLETSYAYDARGNTLTVTTPGGTVTQYAYDGLGRRVHERVDPTGLNLQRSWGYDREGNVLSSADAVGSVTRYAYDAAGRVVFTVGPLGHVQQNGYDAAGRVVKTRTYVTPIATGSLPSAVTPAQVEALLAPVDAQDAVEHRVYDRDGRLAATVDGTGAVVKYAYDAAGNVVARTAFAERVVGYVTGTMPAPAADLYHDETVFTAYDAINRPVYTVNVAGAAVAMAYDGNGNLVRRTSYATPVGPGTPITEAGLAAAVAAIADPARDVAIRNTYDAAGRLTWTVNGAGGVTQRVYDGNGNVVRQVDHAIELPFWAGMASVVQSPNDRSTSMAYDAANRRVMEVDALGAVTEQVFDAEGRVVRRVAYAEPIAIALTPGSPGTADAIRGALAPKPEADRSTRYGYDKAGRLSMVIDAVGAATETRYDGAGRVVATTARALVADAASLGPAASLDAMRALVRADAADRTSRKAYDAAGRLVYTVDPLGAVQSSVYDGAGRLTRSTRYAAPIADATASSAEAISAAIGSDPLNDQSETFTYDAAGQRLAATNALGAQESYTYDALGRKLTFTNAKGSRWSYEYDLAGRLVKETAPQVALTAMIDYGTGNISPVTDLAAAGVVTRLAYDALGNLVARTEAAGRPEERTTRYDYDGAGRQVRVIYPVVQGYDFGFDPVTGVPAGVLTKTAQQFQAVTFYDALGNAVASNDVGGASSHKAYDRMGRVIYELDAMGYVTSYKRDAFGDVRSLTRHATATSLAAGTVTHARDAATAAMVEAALNAPGFDRSRDRTVTMRYDRAGRKTETVEGAAYVYDSSAEAINQTGEFGRTTRHAYDAFGQLVQASTLRNGKTQSWATTTHYFDAAGRETATVDALGYLTRRSYDSVGNLTEQREYATALAPGWTTNAHAAPSVHVDDRVTTYAYDGLNRKTAETRVGIEFSTDTTTTTYRGDATTSFGYDAVGNQTRVTDANGRASYTYYDALGRVVAVAAPPRSINGTYLTPLTVFDRDAHGNAVRKIEYAGGVTGAPAPGFTPPAVGSADRVTLAEFDALGHAISTVDAHLTQAFTAYDAHGHVARKWQGVDRGTRTSFEVNTYDKLGQLVETRTPASTSVYQAGAIQDVSQAQAGAVASRIEYNAFGEVTRKGEEFFDYDTAGRLWRTNSGDGTVRINVHDLQGNVTAELRSAGSGYADVDLRAFASAEAANLSPLTRRTDFRYDLLGRITSRTEAARAEHQGGVVARRQQVSYQVMESGTTTMTYPTEAGKLVVSGNNVVKLAWGNLGILGGGDIKVSIDYLTPLVAVYTSEGQLTTYRGGTARTYTSDILNGDQSAPGTLLTWKDKEDAIQNDIADVGIASVTRIRVHKKNANGYWQKLFDQAPGVGPDEILVEAPPDPNTAVRLQLRTAGSAGDTGWWDAGLVEFSKAYRFDAAGLGAGSYEYRVTVTPPKETARVVATGTVTTTPTMSQAVGQNGDDRWVRPTVLQKTDRWGNVVEITDPRSAQWKTTYRYNASNQLVQQTQPDAGGYTSAASPVTTLHYDRMGRQLAVKDANGNISGQVFNEGGNLVEEVDAHGNPVTHAYNAFGERVETTDALRNKTGFEYDKLGRLVRQWKASTPIYQVDYSLVLQYIGSPQYTELWTYDELGRKLTQTNGNNETIAYTYDLRGNVIATKQAGGEITRAAYDTQDRKIAERDPKSDAKTSTWTYDYFGKLRYHWDLGGRPYDYTYDNAGQLVAQASGRGQSIRYDYDAAGQLTTIRDNAYGKTTSYVYDLSGRKVRERLVQAGITYQDNNMAYDALGRLRDVADARVHMNIDYDKVGNRTRIASSVNFQGTAGETTVQANRYFQYDRMNRQVVVDAVDANFNLGTTQGHRIGYDANGNRISDTYWGTVVTPSTTQPGKYEASSGYTTEVYGYDHLNRLQSVRKDGTLIDYRYYDGAGRVTRSGPTGDLNLAYAELINKDLAPGEMNGKETRLNRYDLNGRMVDQTIIRSDNSATAYVSWETTRNFYAGGRTYTADGYDEAGNVKGYVVKAYDGSVTEYTTTPVAFDSYLAGVTSGTSSALQPGTLTQGYDVNGHLVSVRDAAQAGNNRDFVNDSAGRALYVNQAGRIQRQMIVNGEVLGIYGVGVDPLKPPSVPGANPNFANIVDFDFGYSRITANYPNASPGAYQVRAGDTLQSIAQSAFGDGSLWYRIAEANGLNSDRDLRIGHTLNIPNRAAAVSNNSSTFKPYDPSRITGDLTPAMPMPQDDKGKCGGVGQLLMVIVAIAVTAVLGPGILASAVSAVASQAVGVMTGTIDRFSWKGVALSMISAGVTSAVSAVSDAISASMSGATAGAAGAASPAASWLSGTPGAIVRAGVSNVITQGLGVATGLQRRFDWRGVAASAVGAAVGSAVADALATKPAANLGEQFGRRLAVGLAAGTAAAVMRGGKVAIQQVAVDAFGNALGASLASVSSGAPTAQTGDPLGEFIDKNMPAWEQRQANYDRVVDVFSQGQDGTRVPGVLVADAGDVLRLSRPTTTDDDAYYANIINALQARDAARQTASASFRTGEARATAALYASGAGDVRETTPVAESTLTAPSVPGIGDGYFDDNGQAWLAPITVQAAPSPVEPIGGPSFQEINDQRVIAGTYDRFSEIGRAGSSGNWGDVWRHITFEASPQARDVAIQRIFPPQHPDAVRLERMANSPIGTMASTVGRVFGADQQRQDALLMSGSLLEQLGGAGSQVYKQTLTAPPPPLGMYARTRAVGQPARALPGITPDIKRGVVQFEGMEVRAVRDLGHVDVSTLRAMQKYGFAAKDGAGSSLVLHHHRQNPAGPIIEMPAGNHSIGSAAQHPFGNTKGSGLTVQQRAEFDQWRVEYWKWRATQELQSRGLQ